MACDLTTGRALPCKDSVGGLKAVYFIDYADITYSNITFDATDTDVIDTFVDSPSTVEAFQYDVKGASSFEQAFNSSRETGTTFFEQTLNLTFTKLDKASHKELKLLAYGRPRVIIEDYNGNFFTMGLKHGAEVTGGTIVTGGAMGDLSGYTLVLSAQEEAPANFIQSTATTLTDANVAVSATQITP